MAALQRVLLSNAKAAAMSDGAMADMLQKAELWAAPVTCLADIVGAVAPEASIAHALCMRWESVRACARAASAAEVPPHLFELSTTNVRDVDAAIFTGHQAASDAVAMRVAAIFGHAPDSAALEALLAADTGAIIKISAAAALGGNLELLRRLAKSVSATLALDYTVSDRDIVNLAFAGAWLDIMHWLDIRLTSKDRTWTTAPLSYLLDHHHVSACQDIVKHTERQRAILGYGISRGLISESSMVRVSELLTAEHRFETLCWLLESFPQWRYDPVVDWDEIEFDLGGFFGLRTLAAVTVEHLQRLAAEAAAAAVALNAPAAAGAARVAPEADESAAGGAGGDGNDGRNVRQRLE